MTSNTLFLYFFVVSEVAFLTSQTVLAPHQQSAWCNPFANSAGHPSYPYLTPFPARAQPKVVYHFTAFDNPRNVTMDTVVWHKDAIAVAAKQNGTVWLAVVEGLEHVGDSLPRTPYLGIQTPVQFDLQYTKLPAARVQRIHDGLGTVGVTVQSRGAVVVHSSYTPATLYIYRLDEQNSLAGTKEVNVNDAEWSMSCSSVDQVHVVAMHVFVTCVEDNNTSSIILYDMDADTFERVSRNDDSAILIDVEESAEAGKYFLAAYVEVGPSRKRVLTWTSFPDLTRTRFEVPNSVPQIVNVFATQDSLFFVTNDNALYHVVDQLLTLYLLPTPDRVVLDVQQGPYAIIDMNGTIQIFHLTLKPIIGHTTTTTTPGVEHQCTVDNLTSVIMFRSNTLVSVPNSQYIMIDRYDKDNDGIWDVEEVFPFNPEATLDRDNDGIGDEADLVDVSTTCTSQELFACPNDYAILYSVWGFCVVVFVAGAYWGGQYVRAQDKDLDEFRRYLQDLLLTRTAHDDDSLSNVSGQTGIENKLQSDYLQGLTEIELFQCLQDVDSVIQLRAVKPSPMFMTVSASMQLLTLMSLVMGFYTLWDLELPSPYLVEVLTWVDLFISSVFAIDLNFKYVFRDRVMMPTAKSFWIEHWYNVPSLFCDIPGVASVGILNLLSLLRLLRMLRLFRLFRVVRLYPSIMKDRRNMLSFFARHPATLQVVIGSIVLIFLASVIKVFEQPLHQDEDENKWADFGNVLWFAIVTAASVGYGDIAPTGSVARFTAALIMLFGFAALGTFTAKIAEKVLLDIDPKKHMARFARMKFNVMLVQREKLIHNVVFNPLLTVLGSQYSGYRTPVRLSPKDLAQYSSRRAKDCFRNAELFCAEQLNTITQRGSFGKFAMSVSGDSNGLWQPFHANTLNVVRNVEERRRKLKELPRRCDKLTYILQIHQLDSSIVVIDYDLLLARLEMLLCYDVPKRGALYMEKLFAMKNAVMQFMPPEWFMATRGGSFIVMEDTSFFGDHRSSSIMFDDVQQQFAAFDWSDPLEGVLMEIETLLREHHVHKMDCYLELKTNLEKYALVMDRLRNLQWAHDNLEYNKNNAARYGGKNNNKNKINGEGGNDVVGLTVPMRAAPITKSRYMDPLRSQYYSAIDLEDPIEYELTKIDVLLEQHYDQGAASGRGRNSNKQGSRNGNNEGGGIRSSNRGDNTQNCTPTSGSPAHIQSVQRNFNMDA
eukprot:PhF_6_TR29400/c0_g1_i3/m.43402